MMNREELEASLAQFTGGDEYRRHLGLLVTEGVYYLAEKAGAYWLLDAIASYQPQCRKDPMLREIQFWTLKVKDSKAVLTCDRDQGDEAIRQEIEYTDFPLEEIKVWVEGGVVMLPSER